MSFSCLTCWWKAPYLGYSDSPQLFTVQSGIEMETIWSYIQKYINIDIRTRFYYKINRIFKWYMDTSYVRLKQMILKELYLAHSGLKSLKFVFFLVGGTNNEASISFPFVYKSSSVALGSRKIQASLVLVKLN